MRQRLVALWSSALRFMPSRFQDLFRRSAAAEQLPVDLRGGAHRNLIQPGTVTFILHAPYKPFVSLVGDFNGWDTRTHPLHTDGQGSWWTTIPDPGMTRYGYYVIVDDDTHTWVGDPYATQVDWTVKAPWGVLPAARAPFRWTDRQWRTPNLRDLVIYELCVRDAAGAWRGNRAIYGDFKRLADMIPHLVQTGVNAVELMPINAFPGDSSWGYNPVFYHAVANTYGAPADFKAFVDKCHAQGIAVIMDVAFNHAWGDHPYYRMYPPLFGPNGEWWRDWNPFFHQTPASINMWGGVDWDHFSAETTRYFQDVVRFWLDEYHVDGFRFDWVGGVDYNSAEPMDPGFNPYHGISAICWAARRAKPDCILIAEYWALDGAHPDKSEAKLVRDTPMDAVWNGDFHHMLDDVLNHRWQWEQKDIYRAIGGFREAGFTTAKQLVNYTASHDEVRPEHEIKFYSAKHITRPQGWSVQKVALALARCGLVTLFGAPGVPMIYAGQEYGEDSPRTIDFVPLQWQKLKQPAHAEHFELVRRLIRTRRRHPALRSDHIEFLGNDFAHQHIVRFRRWDDASGDTVVVAVNFGHEPRAMDLPVPHPGRWRDMVGSRIRTAAHGSVSITLGPYDAAMFVPVDTPSRSATLP